MADKLEEQQKRLQLRRQELAETQSLLEVEKQRLRTSGMQNTSIEEQRKDYQKQIDLMNKAFGLSQSIQGYHERALLQKREELTVLQQQSPLEAEKIARLQTAIELENSILQQMFEENAALERQVALRQRGVEQADKLRQKTKDVIRTLTGIDAGWQDTFLGSIMSATRSMSDLRATSGAVFSAFSEATSFGNIFGSTMMKVQEATMGLVMSLDQITVSFRKATGAGTEYNSRILAVYESNRRFGIGLEDSANAFQSLYSGMSGFSTYGAAFQGDLATVGAMLGKVGIDSRTFATNMDIMTKSFGMSAGQARQFSMDFAELGSTIGIPPEELAKQLTALAPRMAMFGSTATRELRRLAAQSKSTGIEMQRLIGIAKGFDTFGDAASKVGQLNALLGGPFLNTIQMMTATDSERNEMLKRVIASSGRMGEVMAGTGASARMLRNALAEVGGFGGDVDTMMRMLGNNLNEFSSKAMGASGSLGTLQQRAADNTTVMEKLVQLASYFALKLEALLNFIRPLIDGVTNLAHSLGDFFIPALLLSGVAFRMVMAPLNLFVGSIFRAGSGVASLGAGTTAATGGIGALGTGAAAASVPLLVFGAAVALIGGGIWAAGKGVANMASGFQTMSKIDMGAIIADMGRMSGAVVTLGTSMARLERSLGGTNLENSIRNLYSMANAARAVGSAIEGIDATKANVMNQIAGGIKATVDSAVQLSAAPEAVAATQRIAAAAARYAEAVSDARNLRDPLKDLIDTIRTSVTGDKTSAAGGGGGRAGGGTSTVILKMNDREFARTVVQVLQDGEFNLVQG